MRPTIALVKSFSPVSVCTRRSHHTVLKSIRRRPSTTRVFSKSRKSAGICVFVSVFSRDALKIAKVEYEFVVVVEIKLHTE